MFLAEKLSDIRSAIEANRVDLYLQPIVTLPQRKVRYYEAMSRLRTERGEVLHAADFIPQAESGGLMPKIDNLVIFRCVQVVRRLLLKNRDIGLFCNIAGSTLTDATVFAQLVEFLDANRAIAPSLVLEFTQSAVRAMGPIEHESLAALAERGYRFSLDNVADLRFEPRELADRSFRFIKIPANLLLNRTGTAATDIHPADLSDLLGRFGVDLIADKMKSAMGQLGLLAITTWEH
jgi:cyclic-di-GMP phosphodiesterase TipF (flagellum assembly factor)